MPVKIYLGLYNVINGIVFKTATTEATTEEVTEATTEAEAESALPYTNNSSIDISSCQTVDDFYRYYAPDFNFLYPKSVFAYSEAMMRQTVIIYLLRMDQ